MDFITDSYQVLLMAWMPKKKSKNYLYWQWQQLWLQAKFGSGIWKENLESGWMTFIEKKMWISCGTLLQSKWETQNHVSNATLLKKNHCHKCYFFSC
jgi:hypothetical protein